jgi:hypothetical protein
MNPETLSTPIHAHQHSKGSDAQGSAHRDRIQELREVATNDAINVHAEGGGSERTAGAADASAEVRGAA